MPQATRTGTRPLSVIYVQRPRNAAIQTYQMPSNAIASALFGFGFGWVSANDFGCGMKVFPADQKG